MLERSISDEVEAAIKAASADKHLETVRRVTDLFLAHADGYTGEQIELFGDVLERLIKTIEIRALADVSARIALAEMSTQLASVKQAPPGVIRRLARHDEISIARPVLTESARLTPEDLVELAETKGEQHLLAISGRWWLTEVVTDALLKRHYPSVSLRLVSNPGAKMSAAGFAIVLKQAESRSCTRGRDRHPRRPAGGAARSNCCAAPPTPSARGCCRARRRIMFEEIRDRDRRGRLRRLPRNVAHPRFRRRRAASSRSLAKHGKLTEAELLGFAKERKYAETVAALAELSGSSIEVIRPVMQSLRDDGVLIPCRVAGLKLGNRRRRPRQPLRLRHAWAATNSRKRGSNTAN